LVSPRDIRPLSGVSTGAYGQPFDEISRNPIIRHTDADLTDGRPDLQMIVYNPATPADQALIRSLSEGTPVTAAA